MDLKIFVFVVVLIAPGLCGVKNEFKVKTPCAATRNVKSSYPIIRVVDEVNDQPGVILGHEGLLYYTLISSRIRREVVIECSSSYANLKWMYKGVGASSGFKIVNTRWTSGDITRVPTCYSTAIVISNVTDQLTGEYKCQEINGTRAKGPRRNSFKLFVPSIPPTYPQEQEVNVTIGNDQGKLSRAPVVLPCISKKMGGDVELFLLSDNGTEPIHYANMRYDMFTGFIIPQNSIVFNNSTKILKHECRFAASNSSFLRVNLVLESEEKIAPEKDVVKSSSPYLSWTTKKNPRTKFTPDISLNVMIWQQFYTKKGFEETSNDAPMFYLGSATIMNLTFGKQGQVLLYDGEKSDDQHDGLIRKWNYFILDAAAEQVAGLKYEDFEYFHVFICKSASPVKPTITFGELNPEDMTHTKNVTGVYNVSNCIDEQTYPNVGCVMLTSYVNQGEVKCTGDGVDETIRYPPLPFEAGRPYFVERGSNLEITLSSDADKVKIPCFTNSEASTSVFLYKKAENGYKKIWSEDDEEFGDSDIEFYPSSGFHLSQANSGEMHELHGEYLCTSSLDLNDTTDAVSVVVKKELGTNFKVHPSDKMVFGRIPFKFSWEADEELEIVALSPSGRNITFGKDENDSKFGLGGKLIIMENTPEGQNRSVGLTRKSDGVMLHEWTFTQIERDAEYRAGLHVETKEDERGETVIVAVCRSKTNSKPRIRYYQCQNEDTCDLMRKCHDKDCYANIHEDNPSPNMIENCEKGCSGVMIRSLFLNGIFNVSCVGDGVNEYRLMKDVFFKDDVVWNAESQEDGYVHLSTSHAVHSADQNPKREIQYIGANLEWELGETVEFSCVAAPFLFSNGIKWAIETKNGKLMFQKDRIFDMQFKYVSTQVASTFSLLIDNVDYSRIYCFVPVLGSSSEWRNASMPIFVRPEASDDYCHESNSIHLINVYPSPSKLSLHLNDTRLDKMPYFVVPENMLQFAVKVSGPKPFSWSFTGSGPSSTPLIQSDRSLLDMYDSSTYCYSTRLLLNLRNKSPNDTGRYVVRHKHDSTELASFYIFVPSKNAPYLLQSGTLNITVPKHTKSFFVPCLVNNPNVKIELRTIDSAENLTKDTNLEVKYDPTRGFLIDNSNASVKAYRCVANGNEQDSLTVYVNPPTLTPELKYEKVNDFHVLTCRSGSVNPPKIVLTEIAADGKPVENSTEYKTTGCSAGCVALITQVDQGSVSCVGDDIDETYRFPPKYNANTRNSDKAVGLWYDNATNTFKCQMNSGPPPTLAAVTCRRPNECEIMKRLLQQNGDTSQATYSTCGEGCAQLNVQVREKSYTAPNWFSIFLRCKSGDNMEILSQYFYDKGTMTYASMENVEQMKKLRIDVPALRRQGKRVFATFRCFANRYFYSRGFQWALEGKNGILDFPVAAATQYEVQNFSAVMSSIDLEINEDKHTAVYCFVPLLDSTTWVNSTITFPIEQLVINI